MGKSDDNVELELELLMSGVRNIGVVNRNGVRSVMCGSGTPHRNMKPLRSDRTHMTGFNIRSKMSFKSIIFR